MWHFDNPAPHAAARDARDGGTREPGARLSFVGAEHGAPEPVHDPRLFAPPEPDRQGGRHGLSLGKLKTYGSGKYEQVTCDETVGTISVYLSYYKSVGGSGGVRIISQTHPAGFGGTATLTVGTGAGNNAPVDYITFRKGPLYADLSANGAEPSKLATLGQEVYKLTP